MGPKTSKVLVVEDDAANRALICGYLARDGYLAVEAETASEALALLHAGGVELMLLDVRLPGMDGIELCRRVRAESKFSRLPIVFLTADRPDEQREAACLEAGGDEYLLKPVSRRVLALRVRNLLRLANAEREQALLAQVAHAEKLAGIGQIAAGVAHEINNPLAFMLSNVASLKGYFADVRAVIDAYRRSSAEGARLAETVRLDTILEDLPPLLLETAQGGERVRKIVQELKTFARFEERTLEPVDLADVVRSLMLLTERELSARARVVKELQPALLERASRPRLHQVVLNLVINALHAVEARELPRDQRHLITISTRLEAGHAVLSVSDTGEGIPEAQRSRIFEPFFSTKPQGIGTGLGLAVSALVVQRLGGTLEVTGEEGEGSTFTLRIPLTALPMAEEPPRPTFEARA